jgi:hypothetical protein
MLRGTIVENSLVNKDILKSIHVVRTWQDGSWVLYNVRIEENQIPALAASLVEGPWYMHFWELGTDTIKVVYKDHIFEIHSTDPSTWSEAVTYGKSIGIPSEQLDFLTENEPIPTPEAVSLADALQRRGVPAHTECSDGRKHVDVCIPGARLYIELEGSQHYLDPDQIARDFRRDHYSDDDGFATLRIPNQVIKDHLEKTASAIHEVVKKRI